MQMLVHEFGRCTSERRPAGKHFPERNSEGIKGGTDVRSYPGKLFRTGVRRCPRKSSLNRNLGNRTVVSNRTFGQAQIDNLRVSNVVAIDADHDVARLDVAMDQILFIDCFQTGGDQRRHLQGGWWVQSVGTSDDLVQRFSVKKAPLISNPDMESKYPIITAWEFKLCFTGYV